MIITFFSLAYLKIFYNIPANQENLKIELSIIDKNY